MDKKTKICIWIILIGLANFFAYTLLYMFMGGEAVNGRVTLGPDGMMWYYLTDDRPVSRAEFLYSGIHSISIWPTVAAILLAMLTLAKDRIVSEMRASIVRGRTFITVLATLIAFSMAVITIWFVLNFTRKLANPITPDMPTPMRNGGNPKSEIRNTKQISNNKLQISNGALGYLNPQTSSHRVHRELRGPREFSEKTAYIPVLSKFSELSDPSVNSVAAASTIQHAQVAVWNFPFCRL